MNVESYEHWSVAFQTLIALIEEGLNSSSPFLNLANSVFDEVRIY